MSGSRPSVRIQVVLFDQGLSDVWHLSKSVVASACHARGADVAQSFSMALGDCSATPVLTEADVNALETSTAEQGMDRLSYEFFNANLGSAGGSNRLARAADEDFILILNPDTYPAPTMLTRLLSVFQDPSIAAADARQIPLEHPKEFDLTTGDTSWGSGSCLLVRTDVFEAVGGFDAQNFFLYCDDVDLSWRIRLRGLRVVHVPEAVVFHDKRIRLAGSVIPTALESYYGILGRLMLARKYSRQDIIEETLDYVHRQGTVDQKSATDEWKRLLDEGSVPAPMEGAERIAQFIGGDYARHRF